ncbi:MAG: rRNA maturation RNase YbeY [Rikenellaceae bacterium]
MITYNLDHCNYKFTDRRKINRWLKESAAAEGYLMGDLNIIFCSAERLLEINREFLQHDYFTDIITFDYSDLSEGYISGELYIDVETVADNATQYGTTPLHEMHRILVHGVMHLCGQADKSPADAQAMRAKEERYLTALSALTSARS